MHEEAILRDLVRKVEEVAASHGGGRVRTVRLWVGALSHLTPTLVAARWPLAAQGTSSEGAVVEVTPSADVRDARAQSVVLVSVDLMDRPLEAGAPGTADSK